MRILSVSPSVTRVIPDKIEERSVQIFIPYLASFSEKKNGWWGRPLLREISVGPSWSKFADFQPIIARSASAKKVQLTLIGSVLRAFQ